MPKNKSHALLNSVNGRRYATIRQTAEYIGCSEKTVRLRIDDGMLTAYRLGPQIVRLDLNEVDATMAEGQSAS